MKNIYALLILLLLTLATALTSINAQSFSFVILLILVLSGIKFLLVAFQFMELKKAHVFWKSLLIAYLVLFVTVIRLIL